MIHQKHKKQKQTAKKSRRASEPAELTFIEHIHELRKRLVYIALVLVVASALGFQFKDFLISAVMAPLNGQQLIYLTPGGGFSFIFTVSLYFGILMTIPFVIYHLFRFLQPIIGKTSRKFVIAFLLISTLLAAAGAAFGYFVTVPAALSFLSTFAGDTVSPSLTADSYLGFVVTYVIGLALVFQLPLVLFIVDHVSPLPPGSLMSTQRYVIIGATVLAAVITPTPDAVNMALVGMPIVMVYQAGALAVFTRRQGRRHKQHRQEAVEKRIASNRTTESLSEPLTEILQEFESAAEEKSSSPQVSMALTPVVANVAPAPTIVRSVDGFGPQKAQSQSAPVQPAPTQPQSARSVDGFTRLAASRSSIRSQIPNRPISPRPATPRQFRSVDGFSMG